MFYPSVCFSIFSLSSSFLSFSFLMPVKPNLQYSPLLSFPFSSSSSLVSVSSSLLSLFFFFSSSSSPHVPAVCFALQSIPKPARASSLGSSSLSLSRSSFSSSSSLPQAHNFLHSCSSSSYRLPSIDCRCWCGSTSSSMLKMGESTDKRDTITYLSQTEAQNLDADLMGPDVGYSVDQLMELAGLSVAQAVYEVMSDRFDREAGEKDRKEEEKKKPSILIVCGPGNNGGDGLVAARHLHLFGYEVHVWYPKPTEKPLFQNLLKQLKHHAIASISITDNPLAARLAEGKSFDLIVDAIFGFSFKGSLRPPFDTVVKELRNSKIPILSVDIPSGWDVEKGNLTGEGLEPDILVSLTAPKLCAKHFEKTHFLGGRFVPKSVKEKYHLQLPDYPGIQEVVRL
ncbi:apolipoprotein a-i binding protein [Cystoisospora suis]|uniref:NAD(P)H-hydrate epimerase n=1 Tax=Cystoisospora suis TaxID=483139 RepID=A0A2C6KNS4_9APIC|nr:apolipoprotein a-i binding protein [Cystoisospora suis]